MSSGKFRTRLRGAGSGTTFLRHIPGIWSVDTIDSHIMARLIVIPLGCQFQPHALNTERSKP
eukprot:5847676-Amphidinium_carterae.1